MPGEQNDIVPWHFLVYLLYAYPTLQTLVHFLLFASYNCQLWHTWHLLVSIFNYEPAGQTTGTFIGAHSGV